MEGAVMEGWWDELDEQILSTLSTDAAMDPSEIAKRLGMSTEAVCSCLAMLCTAGRVRIRSVERSAPSRRARCAA
jgi:DNA-binding Lrp family transcriptional regulator